MKRPHRIAASAIVVFAMALLFAVHRVGAQTPDTVHTGIHMPNITTHPDAYELVQDSDYVLRWYPHDTIPVHMICASYEFQMAYDSLCDIRYIITEWKRNGIPLKLPKWIDQRIANAAAEYLSFNSQTDTFTMRAGDTLSFFRMLSWYSLIPGHNDPDGYVAFDTLDYAVELVRHSDSTRTALLDSIGILPRTTPGKPQIYGSRPFIAPVAYVVPAALDGVKAFMRMRLYHRGSGPYWFTRRDAMTLNLSNIINRPWYNTYMQYFTEAGIAKQVREYGASTSSTPRLKIITAAGSRDVQFQFEAAPPGIPTSILVSDIAGGSQFYPMLWNIEQSGTTQFPYHFHSSGTYLVALLYKNKLQEVVKWVVR
jgi:hypothetical protein